MSNASWAAASMLASHRVDLSPQPLACEKTSMTLALVLTTYIERRSAGASGVAD